MGKSSSSAPKPPDPEELIRLQRENQTSTYTPYGNILHGTFTDPNDPSSFQTNNDFATRLDLPDDVVAGIEGQQRTGRELADLSTSLAGGLRNLPGVPTATGSQNFGRNTGLNQALASTFGYGGISVPAASGNFCRH